MKTASKILCLPLLLAAVGCGKSSSSKEEPAPAADSTQTTQPSEDAKDPGAANPGNPESPLALSGRAISFNFKHYDCGNIKKPLSAGDVASKLKFSEIQNLAATLSGSPQALLTATIQEEGLSCTYRALFSAGSDESINYDASQALTTELQNGCAKLKSEIDQAFASQALGLQYDETLFSWVAVEIPAQMQSSQVCSSGSLRAAFTPKY